MRTLIAIPAYNEAKSLPGVLAELHECQPSADILVIDDCSKDATSEAAHASGAYVVRHPINQGYSVAVQTGAKFARQGGYEVLLWMDGDGQHRPADAAALIEDVRCGRCDVCIGSRFLSSDSYRMPLARRAGSKVFSVLVLILTGKKVRDVTSGFQAMSRRVIELCASDRFPADYPDANLILQYLLSGFIVQEKGVAMKANETGKSMHAGLGVVFYMYHMALSVMTIFLTALFKRRGAK